MDVIEKLIAGHRETKEEIDLLDKLVKLSNSDAFAWDDVFKISIFFEKEVKEHFRLEEMVLFPVMKNVLPLSEQNILTEIKDEHKPILVKLDDFKKMAERHKKISSKNSREDFVNSSKAVIDLLIPHAKKEDIKLFPLVRKYFKTENYKELEEMYFKYLKV